MANRIIPVPKTIRHNLLDNHFGRLTVIGYLGNNSNKHPVWLCRCECGNQKAVTSSGLVTGKTRSCGCYHYKRKHGLAGTPEHKTWHRLISRCTNKRNPSYANYGGRGIKVCDRWRHSFENFYSDMGLRPGSGYSLDRINNDGDYEPGNCRWATASEQANNRSDTVTVTFNDRCQSIAQWAREIDVPSHLIYGRLRRGWSVERALTQPHKPRRSPKKR